VSFSSSACVAHFTHSCATCGLRSRHCPGHPGHIELPVPVVNPMMVSMVYKIMRMLCFNCHNFCAPDGKAWRLEAVALQLQLIEKGLTHEAAEIVDKAAYERAARVYTPVVLAKTSGPAGDTIMATKIKFDIIEKLLGTRTTSCSFCHAVSPGLRKYGAEGSVYRKKMESSAIAKNLKHEIKIEGKAPFVACFFFVLPAAADRASANRRRVQAARVWARNAVA
jgi:DNA-directed RNA polymerase beta' subunit